MPTDFGPIISRLYSSAAGQLPDDLCVLIADYVAISPREKLAQLVINAEVGDFIFLRQVPVKTGGTIAFGIRKSISGQMVFVATPDARASAEWPSIITRQLSDFAALERCIAESQFSRTVADRYGLDASGIFATTFETGLRAEYAIKEVIIPPRPKCPCCRVRGRLGPGHLSIDWSYAKRSAITRLIIAGIARGLATG